jgi:hypothetical protein
MGTNEFTDKLVVATESGDLELLDLLTGEVIAHSDTRPATHQYAFDHTTAVRICQLTAQGKSLAEVCRMPGIPPYDVVLHWLRREKMFSAELQLARRQRGHVYFDEAIGYARAAASAPKDMVPGLAAAMKGMQWAAERSLPSEFGTKVVHEGNEEKPIVMRVVDTGIRRDIKPQIVEVIQQTGGQHEHPAETAREDEASESVDHE